MLDQTISHYRITGQLGSGGMGVVYEAQDLTLGRKVALKFLPPELSKDQSALDRFLLEARAASALNHPNICTIYAVENADGQSFIAMELLEGESLDHRLSAGALPLDRLLDWSIQLADALDAAHAKGIIHRDVKPGNVFVTQRGQVKVLDFGLAKLTQPEMAMNTIGATEDSPRAGQLTSPGSTVGTISYMSPEQARGEPLDPRSDLFSLGTVIYQMATGQLPFSGATSAVVFHAILQLDPVPAQRRNPGLPPKLEEIIHKALEKDRDLRYQSAADLRGDLKRLKRDTESGRKTASSSQSVVTPASSSADGKPFSGTALPVSARGSGAVTKALIALALVAAVSYGIYALVSRGHALPFQNISANKITETGKAALVAVSPDGRYILNVVNDNGQEGLWLRNIPTNSDTQVIPSGPFHYIGLRFSPDGNYLYFVRNETGSHELEYLYRAPVLGGTPEKLVTDIDTNITFSPSGREFAYVLDNNPENGKYRLIVHSLENGSERVLENGLLNTGLADPAWSPDGKTIVCISRQPGNALSGVVGIDVASGKQLTIPVAGAGLLIRPIWLPDQSGLLVLSRSESSKFTRQEIVFVSYPEGKLTPVTRDTNSYSDLGVSSDGRMLATVSNEDHWNLFVRPAEGGKEQGRQVTSGATIAGFTWLPNGQLIIDQGFVLSLLNSDSGAKTPIMAEEGSVAVTPSACAGGRYVVFVLALHAGKVVQNIWRMDASGGNPKQLTDGRLEQDPVCSPDGKWVYYRDSDNGDAITRVPLEGGKSQKLSELLLVPGFDVSQDGKLVVFATLAHLGDHKEKLALLDVDSGKSPGFLEFEHPRDGPLAFSHDGKGVVYPITEGGVENLWLQFLDGSKGRRLTDFTSDQIRNFHWSPDGSKLGVIRGHTDSDVVLIREAQR